jgi:hypothetical protein
MNAISRVDFTEIARNCSNWRCGLLNAQYQGIKNPLVGTLASLHCSPVKGAA